MSLIPDDVLRRDARPAAELARALLAPSIIRLARLRHGVRARTKAEALAAIEAAQVVASAVGIREAA